MGPQVVTLRNAVALQMMVSHVESTTVVEPGSYTTPEKQSKAFVSLQTHRFLSILLSVH